MKDEFGCKLRALIGSTFGTQSLQHTTTPDQVDKPAGIQQLSQQPNDISEGSTADRPWVQCSGAR
jgi:hypothetical protein